MNDVATLLSWRGDLAQACAARLGAIGEELLRLLARVSGELSRLLLGAAWRGAGASVATASVGRRAGVVHRLAGELSAAARAVVESGHRVGAAQATVSTTLERARGEPLLEVGADGRVFLRPLGAVGLLALGEAGGLSVTGLELLARHLNAEISASVADGSRSDRASAASLERLADAARSLLSMSEPALVRADHVRELGRRGFASWLRSIPRQGSRPEDVADWWAAHLPAERAEVLSRLSRAAPGVAMRFGSLDGLPLGLRDQVNRAALDRRLAGYRAEIAALDRRLVTATAPESAVLVRQIATTEAARRVDAAVRAQLRVLGAGHDAVSGVPLRCLLLVDDPSAWGGTGRVSVSVGPADTAEHVAYVVPGFGVQPGPDLGDLVLSARHVYDQARAYAPRTSVAVIAWLGYRTPGWTQVAFDQRARAGAELLARDVAGLRATRFGSPPHLTVIGHSYGSTTASLALRETSARVDDAVFLGSPGLLADHASDLPLPAGHVWVGAASGDEISHLSRFGVDPAARSFGAHRFPAELPAGTPSIAQHTRYLAARTASLRNVARIVVGLGDLVPTAPGRVDSGVLGELERLAASDTGLPVLPQLLGPEPGDPTFDDPAR